MSRPVAFVRYDAEGFAIDRVAQATSGDGVDLLLNVWAGRLKRGEYSRIDLKLANGSFASLKKLKPKDDCGCGLGSLCPAGPGLPI